MGWLCKRKQIANIYQPESHVKVKDLTNYQCCAQCNYILNLFDSIQVQRKNQ